MARAEATGLSLHRDGPALRLSGPLDRDAATSAWPALLPLLDGARVLDLNGVTRLDSALSRSRTLSGLRPARPATRVL